MFLSLIFQTVGWLEIFYTLNITDNHNIRNKADCSLFPSGQFTGKPIESLFNYQLKWNVISNEAFTAKPSELDPYIQQLEELEPQLFELGLEDVYDPLLWYHQKAFQLEIEGLKEALLKGNFEAGSPRFQEAYFFSLLAAQDGLFLLELTSNCRAIN